MRIQFWLHSYQWVEICSYLKFSFEKIDLNQFLYENDCSFSLTFGPLLFSGFPSLDFFFVCASLTRGGMRRKEEGVTLDFCLCIFNQRRDEKKKE